MLEALNWLDLDSESGLWRLLSRLDITYHRGRSFLRSPDDAFDAKCEYLDEIRNRVVDRPDEVLVYMDEMQYFRRPVEERAWEQAGKQPTVTRKPTSRYDWSRHLMGAVEAESGEMWKRHDDSFDRFDFLEFYEQLVETLTDVDRIWLVQDNLPVHFHEDILRRLEPQSWPWAFPSPPNWPDPAGPAKADGELPIQLTPLPTYASWLNPIERLWRDLRRQALYMHDEALDEQALVAQVDAYLERRSDRPEQVLETTGLSCA